MWVVRASGLDGNELFPGFMYETWQEAHEAVYRSVDDDATAMRWLDGVVEGEGFDVVSGGCVYWCQMMKMAETC